jgi:cell fate (sporulation/competence/biofilm development) regulator YlbF (YheA/YmcA/DUF963 family)
MNIETVRDNLQNTIAGKEKYLEEVRKARSLASREEDHALFATQEFLRINIEELKAILADVEQLVAADVERSWRENPDRMGGQFTEEEIRRADEWR